MVMVAQDVVGQSKREKAQSLEGKVFHDYGIGALDLSRTSVLIQFILTSVPHGVLSLISQSQMYAERCANTMPRNMDWPTASLTVCRGSVCWFGMTLALTRHPVDIQAVPV